jgi:hypothetical protein
MIESFFAFRTKILDFFKVLSLGMQSLMYRDDIVSQSTPILVPNIPPTIETHLPVDASLFWDSQGNAYHSTRVLCDNAGLTFDEKNLICACIYQESSFLNTAVCYNKNLKGIVVSTDYGIVQVNDYYHIGINKDFPSVQYVRDNPQKCVEWMISMYKHGLLKMWVSYSSGAYQIWLNPNSPMWKL